MRGNNSWKTNSICRESWNLNQAAISTNDASTCDSTNELLSTTASAASFEPTAYTICHMNPNAETHSTGLQISRKSTFICGLLAEERASSEAPLPAHQSMPAETIVEQTLHARGCPKKPNKEAAKNMSTPKMLPIGRK